LSPHRFQGGGQIRLAFKVVLQAGDLQDFPAILVKVDEFDPAKEFLAFAFHPQERFKSVAVDEPAFLEIDYEIHDLALFDVLLERLPGGRGGVSEEVASDFHDADLAVFLALDAHG
jgi:hypothetical protein